MGEGGPDGRGRARAVRHDRPPRRHRAIRARNGDYLFAVPNWPSVWAGWDGVDEVTRFYAESVGLFTAFRSVVANTYLRNQDGTIDSGGTAQGTKTLFTVHNR